MFDNLCNNNALVHVLKVSMTNQDNLKKRKKKTVKTQDFVNVFVIFVFLLVTS